jgi:ComEC/Rec2-related protein
LRVCSDIDWIEARTPIPTRWELGLVEARSSLLARYSENLSPSALGFVWGISTGDKSLLSPDLRGAFSRIGLAHVLAVSGYHVGLVGFIPLLFARSRRQSFRALSLLGIPLLGAFVLFCGASESAVRAWTMASLLIVASVIRRPGSLGHSLNVAAWAMLVLHPLAMQQLGTQLSFVAVLGIALGLEAASALRLARWAKPMVVPIAAQGATTPIAVPTFFQFPLGFLPVNLVAGPWITAIGAMLMAWLIWPWDAPVSEALLWALNRTVDGFVNAVGAAGEWDVLCLAVVPGDRIRWWALGLGTLAFFIGCFRKHWWWMASALFWASVPWWPFPSPPPSDWVMERSGVPDLNIDGVRWVGRNIPIDSTAVLAKRGNGWWQTDAGWVHVGQEGSRVIWIGLQRKGTWRFAFEPKDGLGRLEIKDHAWIWERWHDRTSGAWPEKKTGTEAPVP